MKLTLNKYGKLDNIEDLPAFQVLNLYELYIQNLKDNKFVDPDYPDMKIKLEGM